MESMSGVPVGSGDGADVGITVGDGVGIQVGAADGVVDGDGLGTAVQMKNNCQIRSWDKGGSCRWHCLRNTSAYVCTCMRDR